MRTIVIALVSFWAAPGFAASSPCNSNNAATIAKIGPLWAQLNAKMNEADDWVPTGAGANGRLLAHQPGIVHHTSYNRTVKDGSDFFAEMKHDPCRLGLQDLRREFTAHHEAFLGFVNGKAAATVNGRYASAVPAYFKFATTHMAMHTDCGDALNARGMVASRFFSDYPSAKTAAAYFADSHQADLTASWQKSFGNTMKHKTQPDCDVYGPGINSLWFAVHAMSIIDMLGRSNYGEQWNLTATLKNDLELARDLGEKISAMEITLEKSRETCHH